MTTTSVLLIYFGCLRYPLHCINNIISLTRCQRLFHVRLSTRMRASVARHDNQTQAVACDRSKLARRLNLKRFSAIRKSMMNSQRVSMAHGRLITSLLLVPPMTLNAEDNPFLQQQQQQQQGPAAIEVDSLIVGGTESGCAAAVHGLMVKELLS